MPDRCEHGRELCSECVVITDAAKRARDIIASYVTFVPWDERVRSWVALRLSDGGSDGVLYPSKREAVRHQSDERLCCYFTYRTAPNGFASVRDAQIFMDWNRAAYDRGFRLPDPDARDGGPDLIMPTASEQLMLQRQAMLRRN